MNSRKGDMRAKRREINKAACHQRHIFCSVTLLKTPSRRMPAFVPKNSLHQNLLVSPDIKFFWIQMKRNSNEKKIMRKYHLISILQPNCHLYGFKKSNFYQKAHLFFSKNPKFVNFEKLYSFSCTIRHICSNLWYKSFTVRLSDTFTYRTLSIGKNN